MSGPIYIPLETAANRLRMPPEELRALCESESVECHGAQFGSQYVVWSITVDRLLARQVKS